MFKYFMAVIILLSYMESIAQEKSKAIESLKATSQILKEGYKILTENPDETIQRISNYDEQNKISIEELGDLLRSTNNIRDFLSNNPVYFSILKRTPLYKSTISKKQSIELNSGDIVQLIDYQNSWYEVSFNNKKENVSGFVMLESFSFRKEKKGGTIYFTDGTTKDFETFDNVWFWKYGKSQSNGRDGLSVLYQNSNRIIPYDKLCTIEVMSFEKKIDRGDWKICNIEFKIKTLNGQEFTDTGFGPETGVGIWCYIYDELTGERISQFYDFTGGNKKKKETIFLSIKKIKFTNDILCE